MDQRECKRLFNYRDGGLYWKVDRGSNAKLGGRAGRVLTTRYRSIHISGKRYQEHRLVYLWHYGVTPDQIDHINRDRADNRIENLRPADHSKNQMNTADRRNQSGFRGVRFVPKTGRWAARIYQKGREIRIGTFSTPQEASDAYKKEARKRFGDFA